MRLKILKSLNKKSINALKQRYPLFFQLTFFCIVGTSGLAVMLITYYLFIWMRLNVQLANLAGYFMSTVYSYLLDFVFVFGAKGTINKGSAAKFFLLYFILYFYSAFLIYLIIDVLHINELIAPVINAMLITPPSFLFSKYWVFKKAK
jgi:putative flippase GtrA